jgi:hypothetical protein
LLRNVWWIKGSYNIDANTITLLRDSCDYDKGWLFRRSNRQGAFITRQRYKALAPNSLFLENNIYNRAKL